MSTDRKDAARLGFCDAEALVALMLETEGEKALAYPESAGVIAEAEAACHRSVYSATPEQRTICRLVMALRSLPLAVKVGRHRTTSHDPDELSRAHQRAANTPQRASRGGKASAAKLSPEERRERATNAVNARWAKQGEKKCD